MDGDEWVTAFIRGIAVLPISLLEIDRPGITMRPFEPPAPVIEMGAVYVGDNDSPPLRMFMTVVRAVAQSHARDEIRLLSSAAAPRPFTATTAPSSPARTSA